MNRKSYFFGVGIFLLFLAAQAAQVLTQHAGYSDSLNPIRFLPSALYILTALAIGAFARNQGATTESKLPRNDLTLMWTTVILWVALSLFADYSPSITLEFSTLAAELVARLLYAAIPAIVCMYVAGKRRAVETALHA